MLAASIVKANNAFSFNAAANRLVERQDVEHAFNQLSSQCQACYVGLGGVRSLCWARMLFKVESTCVLESVSRLHFHFLFAKTLPSPQPATMPSIIAAQGTHARMHANEVFVADSADAPGG